MIVLQPSRRLVAVLVVVLLTASGVAASGRALPRFLPAADDSGQAGTVVTGGPFTVDNAFFRSLGTNGRACVTCHTPTEGWSITPAAARARFERSDGREPLFRTNDGAVSPHADVSTVEARRAAYALLLARGVIRVGLPVPAGAEFELQDVDDPYGFASATELSLFRRPLPSANLAFLASIMWDGRETFTGETIHFGLAHQANGATTGHAEGEPLAPAVREEIVDFEVSLHHAQTIDVLAGPLRAAGAAGGPWALSDEPFWPGINSPDDPTGTPATATAFRLFDAWATAPGRRGVARQSVARGQVLFNEREFGARGSTCSSCHNAPNVGSSSTGGFFDVGVAAAARRSASVPLYTFACIAGPAAGEIIRTTDPGLGLVTGRCRDIGRFKVPALRGLAARPPYFHDGSSPTLEAVVEHYDARFGIGLTDVDKHDLVAFLRAL